MSFLNGKPFIATEEHVKSKWGGGFHCKLCGHKFAVDDTVRFIYANGNGSNGSGNFLVCQECDGPDVLERGRQSFAQALNLARQWNIYAPEDE
jgi:hypothetical protein